MTSHNVTWIQYSTVAETLSARCGVANSWRWGCHLDHGCVDCVGKSRRNLPSQLLYMAQEHEPLQYLTEYVDQAILTGDCNFMQHQRQKDAKQAMLCCTPLCSHQSDRKGQEATKLRRQCI